MDSLISGISSFSALQLFCYFIVINALTYALYFFDKKLAKSGAWRIPEFNLLMAGFLGGTIAAIFAQKSLRHKTKKQSFQYKFYLLTLLQIFIVLYLIFIVP